MGDLPHRWGKTPIWWGKMPFQNSLNNYKYASYCGCNVCGWVCCVQCIRLFTSDVSRQ